MTGRVADGVILQLADPDLIAWFVGTDPRGGGRGRPTRRIGPDPVGGAGPCRRPRAECRERTRWFPALVSNHVVDLVNKYPREQLPEALTGYIRDREGYDYLHHAEVGSSNAGFVGDEVTDRFCVLGSVDDHVAKLQRLAEAGVDQFNIYLMNGDEEAILEVYGREIIPAIRTPSGRRPAPDRHVSRCARPHRLTPDAGSVWCSWRRVPGRIGGLAAAATGPHDGRAPTSHRRRTVPCLACPSHRPSRSVLGHGWSRRAPLRTKRRVVRMAVWFAVVLALAFLATRLPTLDANYLIRGEGRPVMAAALFGLLGSAAILALARVRHASHPTDRSPATPVAGPPAGSAPRSRPRRRRRP